ncbi:hypothetical protein CEE36_04025 [candidate division TA06 bacterium B3_TA06]|uniref:DUF5723 domain-containing protein n=1 Tax=candidate division TA06 bacterium B3_TA06 TaxID=2012487 RepID=A0A532V8H0_UNCT6|nr:MAG: hypothetical protein CEE36_04025 [candidate division TA06 bacterium B3_TA06]
MSFHKFPEEKKKDCPMVVVVLILGFCSASFGFWWNPFTPSVVDVRSVAMGNTGSVTVTGSNAIFCNPALLGESNMIEAQLGGRFYFGAAEDESEDKFEGKYLPLPTPTHLSFSMPFQVPEYKLKVVPAIGYHLELDLTAKREMSWEDLIWGETQIEETATGGLDVISPAVAVQFLGKYSVGLALNVGGITKMRDKYSDISMYDSRQGDTAGYYDYWDYESETEISPEGSFVLFGVFAEFIPEFAAALTYRTGFKWKWDDYEEDVDWTWITWDPYDEWDTLEVHDKEKLDDVKFELPGIFTVGVRSKISSILVLAAEYQTRPFSDVEIDGEDLEIENGSVFRLGAELITPVLIRAGFYHESIPMTDIDDEDPKALTGITAGLGIPIASVAVINGSFEYAFWNQEINDDHDEYSENLYRIGLSVRLHFPNPL